MLSPIGRTSMNNGGGQGESIFITALVSSITEVFFLILLSPFKNKLLTRAAILYKILLTPPIAGAAMTNGGQLFGGSPVLLSRFAAKGLSRWNAHQGNNI